MSEYAEERPLIAVVIPCYRVKRHILPLLSRIGDEVWRVYVVDDCCPEGTGEYVKADQTDPRVTVLFNQVNLGVGGTVMAGFAQAAEDGADILVKIDGDGQMDPAILHRFTSPIERCQADYTKGNRFYDLTHIRRMPFLRLLGNTGLSFMTKVSSGYWNIFDPTNVYVAISAKVFRLLPTHKINRRYFFETDMLFRLNIIRAVVLDVPMDAIYNDEQSNLSVSREFSRFLWGHTVNTFKRIVYNYFLRDMNVGSMELVIGLLALMFGVVYGTSHLFAGYASGTTSSSGVVMMAALPVIIGIQLLLGFVAIDIASVPTSPIQMRL